MRDPLNGLENSLKVQRKLLDALLDDRQLQRKRDEEQSVARVRREPSASSRAERRSVGSNRSSAGSRRAAILLPYGYLEDAAGFNSRLFRYARLLVRAAAERPKPNTDRLREYTDASLPRIEQQLGAQVPIYPELERLTLSYSLERMREWLGPDHPVVRRLLSTESPDSLAAALVDGSKLGGPGRAHGAMERRAGGRRRVAGSDDRARARHRRRGARAAQAARKTRWTR